MKEYRDILNLPHFHAPGRPFMPNSERAAQFMPFKSLKGYDELVATEESKISDDSDLEIELLDDDY